LVTKTDSSLNFKEGTILQLEIKGSMASLERKLVNVNSDRAQNSS
jgi:hypothetical protein